MSEHPPPPCCSNCFCLSTKVHEERLAYRCLNNPRDRNGGSVALAEDRLLSANARLCLGTHWVGWEGMVKRL